MMLSLQEFLRGTNGRRFIACGTAHRLNPVPQGGIGNMRTIPGHQVIHAMDGGHSDMQGVYLGIGGEWDVREQGVRQLLDGVGDVQWWQVCQHG
jgi:hypothetical protein